jgi:hypothetical protein
MLSSILIRPSTGQTSQPWKADFNRFPHRPSWLELRSNLLPGHQLEWSLGPFNLWKQVQKSPKSVDFTTAGA